MSGRGTRFWARVDSTAGADECWPFIGHVGQNGYGQLKFEGVVQGAHRVALELASGQTGKIAMHSCDNRACCNPAHLSWGTQLDNMADMRAKGRSNTGEKHYRAKLKAADVASIRQAFARGERNRDIARRFGVSVSNIEHIKYGYSWSSTGARCAR